MERNLILSILALTFIAIGLAILLPGGRQTDPNPKLPWDIETHADGSSTLFGLRFGVSTLQDAQTLLQLEPELTLFKTGEDGFTVEAYFERVFLSGLKADMVFTLEIPQEQLEGIYERGLRAAKLGSGVTKVTLTPGDIAAAASAPLRHLTYLPVADLDEDLLQSRFGAPKEKIKEKGGSTHWLYPEKGLDIAVDPDRKEVFQYVAPKDFEHLVSAPLQAAGQAPVDAGTP
jgi:hypothetical protein